MINCDPSALVKAAACYDCLPKSSQWAVALYLACGWMQEEQPECGDPSNTIVISGAGTADANGTYTYDPSQNGWFIGPPNNPIADIYLLNGIYYLEDQNAILYTIAEHDFPCGPWIKAQGGTLPVPTGQFGGSGSSPFKATNPNPASGATNVSPYSPTLSWSNGGGATSYDVWFNGVFQGNQASTTFNPGVLAGLSGYAWRVDAVNASGTTTGDVWVLNTGVKFSYTPISALMSWNDSGGAHTGNLTFFDTHADIGSVYYITLNHAGITAISGFTSLPALTNISVVFSNINTLDLTGLETTLTTLQCDHNQLTTLNLGGFTALVTCNCDFNLISSLNLTGCISLNHVSATFNNLAAPTLHGVNDVLIQVDAASPYAGGDFDLSNNAAATAPAHAAYTDLISNGWSVNVDPPPP